MKRGIALAAALLTLMAGPAAADPASVKVNDLIEQAAKLDGQTVTVEGEVVGDRMIRGDHGWINISDPTGDIGLWAPASVLQQVDQVGRYKSRGDRIQARGQFHRACPEHGGDLDIHVESLTVVGQGGPIDRAVRPQRLWWALGALAAGGGTAFAFRLRTRRLQGQ